LKVACIEEIAYRQGYVNRKQFEKLTAPYKNNGYGQYLLKILNEA